MTTNTAATEKPRWRETTQAHDLARLASGNLELVVGPHPYGMLDGNHLWVEFQARGSLVSAFFGGTCERRRMAFLPGPPPDGAAALAGVFDRLWAAAADWPGRTVWDEVAVGSPLALTRYDGELWRVVDSPLDLCRHRDDCDRLRRESEEEMPAWPTWRRWRVGAERVSRCRIAGKTVTVAVSESQGRMTGQITDGEDLQASRLLRPAEAADFMARQEERAMRWLMARTL